MGGAHELSTVAVGLRLRVMGSGLYVQGLGVASRVHGLALLPVFEKSILCVSPATDTITAHPALIFSGRGQLL
jgi:hypothetical protein